MDHETIEQAAETTRKPDAAQRQVASRRRFLKGTSLALPAVMTLHSVSAQAVARSSSSCGNNFQQSGFTPLTNEPDGFFRNTVAVYDTLVKSIEETDEGPVTVYKGDGIVAFFAGEDSSGGVIRDLTGKVVANPFALDDPLNPTKSVNYPDNPNYVAPTEDFKNWDGDKGFAIVMFESNNGTVAAVGEATTIEGTIVTSLSGACLHSLWGRTV